MEKKSYDFAKRNQAMVRAGLRGAVALYLLYLAANIVRGAYRGGTAMPVWAAWALGAAFALAAAVFGVYAWRRCRADLRAAELPAEDPEDAAR